MSEGSQVIVLDSGGSCCGPLTSVTELYSESLEIFSQLLSLFYNHLGDGHCKLEGTLSFLTLSLGPRKKNKQPDSYFIPFGSLGNPSTLL